MQRNRLQWPTANRADDRKSERRFDRKIILRLWIALLLACLSGVVRAADMHFEARWEGDVIDLTGRAEVPADLATAWRVLTDYGRYPHFIPDLAMSRVVSRNGDDVVIEQRGEARWLFFRQPLEVRFAVTETAPTTLRSRAVSASFLKLESRYDLQPLPGGGVRLEYSGHFVPAPGSFAFVDLAAARVNLRRQFEALVREMSRQGGGEEPASSEAPSGS